MTKHKKTSVGEIPTMIPKLLTVDDVALAAQTSTKLVRRHVELGTLRRLPMSGCDLVRFRLEDVVAWMEHETKTQATEGAK